MSSVWTRLPALLLPLLAVGCRFSDPDLPPPLDEVLRTGEWSVATQATPQRYRLALAPVRVGFDPRRLYPMDATRHGALPDLKALQRELAQGLGELGVFETVEPRGERESSSAEVAAEAWEANDDLILEVELTDYHQAYLGHSNYVWWFVSYVTYIWPAWFVPVDYYGCGLEARVALRGLQRNSPALLERVLRVVPEEVSRELTPSDRELAGLLDLGALFNLENSLEESNWRAVERWVGSFARRRFVLDLLGQVEEVVGKPLRSGVDSEREAVLSKTRKRLALVVGVSTFADPALGAAPFAAEDAHATAELWSSAPGGALEPNRELTLLVDQAATREAVLSGVAAIASRAGPGDEVLIYFAGHGSSAGGRSQLALYDTEAARLAETSLSLRDLQIALRGVRAQQVLVSLDAAFRGADPGGRAVGARATRVEHDLEAPLPGRVFLFATGPQERASVLPEAGVGLFSQVLRDGLAGRADADEDGRVSLAELLTFLSDEVRSRAAFEGNQQSPQVVGDPASLRLSWPR